VQTHKNNGISRHLAIINNLAQQLPTMKLSCRWQTARRICTNAVTWLT